MKYHNVPNQAAQLAITHAAAAWQPSSSKSTQ